VVEIRLFTSCREKLLRSAVLYFWWCQVGVPYLLGLVPGIVLVSYRISLDGYSWINIAILTLILVYSISMVVLLFEYRKLSRMQLNLLNDSTVYLDLENENFRITNNREVETIDWSSIRGIKNINNVLILILARHKFFMLPASDLTDEVESIIFTKIDSVLSVTKQIWKVKVMNLFGYLSVLLVFGPYLVEGISPLWLITLNISGLFFAIASIFFLFYIKCPNCNTRWLFEMAKANSGGHWLTRLISLKKCPKCGEYGSTE